jgi:hypothetical protein
MTHAEALEGRYLLDMSEEERKRFTPSELILYKHALEYKWTVEQLKKVIAMVRDPEFNSKDIDPDLHRRMEKAVEDGRIKCFNMREGPADGDQDLNCWMRDLEDLVREIGVRVARLEGVLGWRARAENFESIHSHNAIAVIESGISC